MMVARVYSWIGALIVAFPSAVAGDELGGSGLTERTGRHIRLITDLADPPQADELVASFDAAVPQWLDFWDLPPDAAEDWQVVAYVMRDRDRFRHQGLIPERLPEFQFGYSASKTVWVMAQPSEYYTRHLLLHEGIHSLALYQFDGPGPTWFMEGTAELLATHRGVGPALQTGTVPRSREEVPHWGRFKLMAERRGKENVPTIETVMRMPPRPTGDAEAYGWSWAAAMLLQQYPETRDTFQAAARRGRDQSNEFTRQIYQRLRPQWPIIVARWRMLTHELDYGFDWDRERVELATTDPLWDGQRQSVEVESDRGWQSLGVRIPAGSSIRLTADGRCTIAHTTKPWISEPAGVTIRYHRGQPLGRLLVCRLPCQSDTQPTLKPLDITGYEGDPMELTVDRASWLLLRINDAVGELDENQGGYRVSIDEL